MHLEVHAAEILRDRYVFPFTHHNYCLLTFPRRLQAIVCAAWNIVAARSRQGSVSHTDQDLCLSLSNLIRVSPHYETPKTLQVLRQLLCRKLVDISSRLQKKAVVQGEVMQPQEITGINYLVICAKHVLRQRVKREHSVCSTRTRLDFFS